MDCSLPGSSLHGILQARVLEWVAIFFSRVEVNNLPTIQETQFQSLGLEDSPEESTATHSSILAWRIPWTEDPGGLQSMGLPRVGHNWSGSRCTKCSESCRGCNFRAPDPGENSCHQRWLQAWPPPHPLTHSWPVRAPDVCFASCFYK